MSVIKPIKDAELPEARMQEVFIPVHEYVRLYPEEVAVISHPAFQRLRRVRQLGFAQMVFPGGTHSRFEHSIGALHVAQRILNNLDLNYKKKSRKDEKIPRLDIANLDNIASMFIRLGALLHDIGHVPFGHTLEDELEHLDKHDKGNRIERIVSTSYKNYCLDPALGLNHQRPNSGWSLKGLIDALYQPYTTMLLQESTSPNSSISSFEIVEMIISKPPDENAGDEKNAEDEKVAEDVKNAEDDNNTEDKRKKWGLAYNKIAARLPLEACRDIVGNTICADLLDYLFRDWYHLGRFYQEDKRIYQYMEVRSPEDEAGSPNSKVFVINVGSEEKLRRDALTNIIHLLDLRYKLAETVLFHRTKLSITALLDRCLIEIRRLYIELTNVMPKGGWERYFQTEALELLLNGSDDALCEILSTLSTGGRNQRVVNDIKSLTERQRELFLRDSNSVEFEEGRDADLVSIAGPRVSEADIVPDFDIERQKRLIDLLVDRLKTRSIYTLAGHFGMNEVSGAKTPENREVVKITERYQSPERRSAYLSEIEALCCLPEGSLIMYCPPSAQMNAKIANVKLLIDGQIETFWGYETREGQPGYT